MSEELLDNLISSYPDLDSSNPSSWVFLSDNLEQYHEAYNKVCHADMRHIRSVHWTKMLCAVYGRNALDYITHIINGPFKQYKELIELKKYKDTEDYYLEITGLDKFPANALFNFCIATRAPIEFPATLENWYHLQKLGMPSDLALIVAAVTDYETQAASLDDKGAYCGVPNSNHWWFNSASQWERILNGDLCYLSRPYKGNNSGCLPTNVIWGESDPNVIFEMFESHSLKQIMEKYNRHAA